MNSEDLPENLPLGRQVAVARRLDPALLAPVPRQPARTRLGLDPGEPLPFHGEDRWQAWEFCWLDSTRVPHAAALVIRVPCASPALIESKSMKLYLFGYSGTPFADEAAVLARLEQDLGAAAGCPVSVALVPLESLARQRFAPVDAESLDALGVGLPEAAPEDCLPEVPDGELQLQAFHTDLFGSLCPVTGQPDWGSVTVVFEGPPLDASGLMRYLLAYRDQAGFHEDCAERIFLDLWRAGTPAFLSVHCRYTRRGGIDINPYRASTPGNYAAGRLVRQ